MNELKVGDTVKLNSGSPVGTVVKTLIPEAIGKVEVIWAGNAVVHVLIAPPECFTKVDPAAL